MNIQANGRGVDEYDVVVVGGGAAGLSGAKIMARSRRSVLLVDAGTPRNGPAEGVHNYLYREGESPARLRAIGQAELTAYGAQVVNGRATAAVDLGETADGHRFQVTLDDGRRVRARRLLLATGLVDELPPVPGLRERWGRDVLHCPFCHGWEVRDRRIGVLATGPMAVHQALLFRQLSDDVVVFAHTGPPPTAEQREQLDALGVAVVDGEVAGIETSDDALSGVRLAGGEVVARDALAVSTKVMARADLVDDLGLEFTDLEIGGAVMGRAVAAEALGRTAVAGVWVAGNVAEPMAQVISAAASGAATGAAIHMDLILEDTATAVAAYRAGQVTAVRVR